MESWGIVGGGQKGAQIFALLGYPVLTYIQLGTSQSDLKPAGFLTKKRVRASDVPEGSRMTRVFQSQSPDHMGMNQYLLIPFLVE
jgi:hypothetical protein